VVSVEVVDDVGAHKNKLEVVFSSATLLSVLRINNDFYFEIRNFTSYNLKLSVLFSFLHRVN
jgi:hypothetical protein